MDESLILRYEQEAGFDPSFYFVSKNQNGEERITREEEIIKVSVQGPIGKNQRYLISHSYPVHQIIEIGDSFEEALFIAHEEAVNIVKILQEENMSYHGYFDETRFKTNQLSLEDSVRASS